MKLKSILVTFVSGTMLGYFPDSLQTADQIFTHIYENNLFHDPESFSGTGSTLEQTAKIRNELARLFRRLKIKKILDAPCGDFNWMKEVNLGSIEYIGVDIVKDLIDANNKKFSRRDRQFLCLDVTKDDLPASDLVLCRDLFIHFPNAMVFDALKKFKKSGAKFLLTTFYPNFSDPAEINKEIKIGYWRPVNLAKPPFNFPKPMLIIHENATDFYPNNMMKSLGLWDLSKITI